MGFVAESNQGAIGNGGKSGLRSLVRRKRVDSVHSKSLETGHHQLAKELSIAHLIAIGKTKTKQRILLFYHTSNSEILSFSFHIERSVLILGLRNLSGVGSTIGAGVYILVGTVAREHSGPALAFSFLIAGIAAALSAFCYAELASRCPSAGSAYHYSYICVGEG